MHLLTPILQFPGPSDRPLEFFRQPPPYLKILTLINTQLLLQKIPPLTISINSKELIHKLILNKRFFDQVLLDSIVVLVYYLFLLLIEEVLFD